MMDELEPESLPSLDTVQLPGSKVELEAPIMANGLPEGWALHQHGLVKGAMMLLGLPHHHEGDDIVVRRVGKHFSRVLASPSMGRSPCERRTPDTLRPNEFTLSVRQKRC